MVSLAARVGILLIGVVASFVTGCGGGGSVTTRGGGTTGGAATQTVLTAQDVYALAEAARQAGNSEAALAGYERILAQFPASDLIDDALIGTGEVRLSLQDFAGARDAFTRAGSLDGASRAAEARLAVGRAWVAEFDALDGGTLGFVDEQTAGELLANLEAIAVFEDLLAQTSLPAALKKQARLLLADAYFRGRRFAEARAEYGRYIGLEADGLARRKADVQVGLAFVQERDAEGAQAAFTRAGATIRLPAKHAGFGASAQFGSFGTAPFIAPGLVDLVIRVRQEVAAADDPAIVSGNAEFGVTLAAAYALGDRSLATELLRELKARNFPIKAGDAILLQLGDLLREGGRDDEAFREYDELSRAYPGSALRGIADSRAGDILFGVFSDEAKAKRRIEGNLIANLVARLKRATQDTERPDTTHRVRALSALGRLVGEGIPIPLTVAMPGGLEAGVLGKRYDQSLLALGASGDARWTLAEGADLPPGLSLDPAGRIFGAPTQAGLWRPTLEVSDAANATATATFALEIKPFIISSSKRLVDAIQGRNYSVRIQAEGQGPFRFRAAQVSRLTEQGRLVTTTGFVPGLTLSDSGQVSGLPTEVSGPRPYLLSIVVEDGRGRRQAETFAMFVVRQGQAGPALLREAHAALALHLETSAPQLRSSSQVPARGTSTTTLPLASLELAFSPDGTQVLSISGLFQSVLSSVDLRTGQIRQVALQEQASFGEFPFTLRVSPDGSLVAIAFFSNARGRVEVFSTATLQKRTSFDTGARTSSAAFTPDGRTVVARSEQRVTSLELASATTRTIDTSIVGDGRAFAVLGDSRRVLLASENTSNLAAIVDIISGTLTSYSLPSAVAFCDFLPGDRLALLQESFGAHLQLLDLESGAVERVFVGAQALNFATSADGRRAVAVSGISNELTVLDIAPRRVRRVRLPFGTGPAAAVVIAPDGSRAVAFERSVPGGDRAIVVDLATLDYQTFDGLGVFADRQRLPAVISPDGRMVAGSALFFPRSELRVLDLDNARPALGIERRPLAAAMRGVSYEHRFLARGGAGGYSFEQPSDARIGDLTLDSDGRLHGVPLEADLFLVEGKVRDTGGAETTFAEPILVREEQSTPEPLLFLTRVMRPAILAEPYSQALAVTGGTPPYRFRLTGGRLPDGLNLRSEGTIVGEPVTVETTSFQLEIKDDRGSSRVTDFTLTVLRPSPFRHRIEVELPAVGLAVAAIDLNRDAKTDLAVAQDNATTNVGLYISGPTGVPRPPQRLQVRDLGQTGSDDAVSVRQLIAGDFDGDGIGDLLARVGGLGLGTREPSTLRPVLVPLFGDGVGGLTLAPALDIPDNGVEASVGDLQGDGRSDVVASSIVNRPEAGFLPQLFVSTGRPDRTFASSQHVVTTNPYQGLRLTVVGDFDGRGVSGVAALVTTAVSLTVPLPDILRVYPAAADGTVAVTAPRVTIAASDRLFTDRPQLVARDLNRDGKDDLIVVADPGSVRILLSEGDGRFADPIVVETETQPGNPVVGDITGDAIPDVFVPVLGSAAEGGDNGYVLLLPGRSGGSFEPAVRIDAGVAPLAMALGDFDGDGKKDIAVVDAFEPKLTLLYAGTRK